MRSLQVSQLATWAGPPLLLVRPPVWHYNWFSFAATRRMLDAGYAAAQDALDRAGDALRSAGGVYPRRTIELSVIRERCIGCTLCVTLAPDQMAMDAEGKAFVLESPLEWSRADGDFIHQCPTDAIQVAVLEGDVRTVTMERRIED
jgi:NTE family protein